MNEAHRARTFAGCEEWIVDFVVFAEADAADWHLALILNAIRHWIHYLLCFWFFLRYVADFLIRSY